MEGGRYEVADGEDGALCIVFDGEGEGLALSKGCWRMLEGYWNSESSPLLQ